MAGYIIYEGPSLYDNAPIVVIATTNTSNRKTGGMVQTWIIRQDVAPNYASRVGLDSSVCGNCVHKGQANPDKESGVADKRSCYVLLQQAPLAVFKAYKRGRYKHASPADIGKGQKVRVGSYGDGACVPQYIWDSLLSESLSYTAYTHAESNPMPSVYMTSADSLLQAKLAWHRGERTFRVVKSVAEIDSSYEVICPASNEAGNRTTCDKCNLCKGNSIKAKSIAIVDHGPQRKKTAIQTKVGV